MTNKEVHKQTGYAESTVRKYAPILGVKFYGTGRRKVYDWTDADVERFQEKCGKKRNEDKGKLEDILSKLAGKGE
jgi:hypothetical protein